MFKQFYQDIRAHSQDVVPEEALGVIHNGTYIRLKNVHPDPENHFLMSDEDMAKYMTSKGLEAIVHSHPPDRETDEDGVTTLSPRIGPSRNDMKQQIATAVPWVLCCFEPNTGLWHVYEWGEHTLDLPLLERPFVHGVEDCYTLIRKWWWQEKQVRLSDYPRDDYWWHADDPMTGADMYIQNFEKEGFRRISPTSPADLREGDVFLYKLASRTYNHGGVYIGKGLLAHHAPNRLSDTTPLGPFFRRIDLWLRRDSDE